MSTGERHVSVRAPQVHDVADLDADERRPPIGPFADERTVGVRRLRSVATNTESVET